MTRIRLCRKWLDFGKIDMPLQQYDEMEVDPTVYYSPPKELGAVVVALNPRSYSMCHFAKEMGLRIERRYPP